jgi:hypothetical protein
MWAISADGKRLVHAARDLAPYSITSSARARIDGGIVSALALLRPRSIAIYHSSLMPRTYLCARLLETFD